MSIVHTHMDFRADQDEPCSCCGEKVYPPFMIWNCAATILICDTCAEHIKDGFCADLVHLAALKQFEKFQPNGTTLARATVRELEAKDRELWS